MILKIGNITKAQKLRTIHLSASWSSVQKKTARIVVSVGR
jgi:hypothetical protein